MLPTSHVSEKRNTKKRVTVQKARKALLSSLVRRSLLSAASFVMVCTGISSLTGCSTFSNGFSAMANNGAWNDTMLHMRNRSYSAKAWHKRKQHFCDQKHSNDFCNGFRAGYEGVADGQDGCTPPFPPQDYWGWQFQSAEGANRTSAWFAGYPHGARAAEEDGVNNWSQLQMSAGMQAQYQQVGVLKHEGALYPIPAEPIKPYEPEVAEQLLVPEAILRSLPPGAQLVPDLPSPTQPLFNN